MEVSSVAWSDDLYDDQFDDSSFEPFPRHDFDRANEQSASERHDFDRANEHPASELVVAFPLANQSSWSGGVTGSSSSSSTDPERMGISLPSSSTTQSARLIHQQTVELQSFPVVEHMQHEAEALLEADDADMQQAQEGSWQQEEVAESLSEKGSQKDRGIPSEPGLTPEDMCPADSALPELQSLAGDSDFFYASDGYQYNWSTFSRWYADPDIARQEWLRGQRVTAGTRMILIRLASQESLAMTNFSEGESFQDALDVVTWWTHTRSSERHAAEPGRQSNGQVFLRLANSVALPLWYRELELSATESHTTVLDLSRGERAWNRWKSVFKATQLTDPQKRQKPREQRSMFEASVSRIVGSTMIAKSIITLGPTCVDEIVMKLAAHKRSEVHKKCVKATHEASDEVKAIRQRYRVCRDVYEKAKKEYARHDWDRYEPSEVVNQFQSGALREQMNLAYQAMDLVRVPQDNFLSSLSSMLS